jgi:hypothetical protein
MSCGGRSRLPARAGRDRYYRTPRGVARPPRPTTSWAAEPRQGFHLIRASPGSQLVTERTTVRLVIEQRYSRKMIMCRLAIFSRVRPQACSSGAGRKGPRLPMSAVRKMSSPHNSKAISASGPAGCSSPRPLPTPPCGRRRSLHQAPTGKPAPAAETGVSRGRRTGQLRRAGLSGATFPRMPAPLISSSSSPRSSSKSAVSCPDAAAWSRSC